MDSEPGGEEAYLPDQAVFRLFMQFLNFVQFFLCVRRLS